MVMRKVGEYAQITGVDENKLIEFIKKGHLQGDEKEDGWFVAPSPFKLLVARLTDDPLAVIKRHSRKLMIAMAVIFLLITNPDAEQHAELFSNQVVAVSGVDNAGKGGIWAELGSQLAKSMMLAGMADRVDFHNFYLFSVWMFDGGVHSIGLAGKVFEVGKVVHK